MIVVQEFDRKLFEWLFGSVVGSSIISQVAIILNKWLIIFFVATAGLWLFVRSIQISNIAKRSRAVVDGFAVLFSGVLAYSVSTLIGFIYFRPRPFVALGFDPLVLMAETSKSFPSNHATGAFAVAMALWFIDKRVGAAAFAVAAIIAYLRIAVGVHYPIDAVAGVMVGCASALFVRVCKERLWRV